MACNEPLKSLEKLKNDDILYFGFAGRELDAIPCRLHGSHHTDRN